MGNPDEIWTHRKGSPSADLFRLSDLQSATPPVRLVAEFRRIIISRYPSLKEIDSYNIIIKRHGEVEEIPEESPVSLLAGNTEETPHIVEVRPMNLEVHSGQQKGSFAGWLASLFSSSQSAAASSASSSFPKNVTGTQELVSSLPTSPQTVLSTRNGEILRRRRQ